MWSEAEAREYHWLEAARKNCASHLIVVANDTQTRYETRHVKDPKDLSHMKARLEEQGLRIVKVVDIPQPKTAKPNIGDIIYVHGAMYIDRGQDDRVGGQAKITKVFIGISAGNPVWFVNFEAISGGFNYDYLMSEQEKLKARYKDNWAAPDPDYG